MKSVRFLYLKAFQFSRIFIFLLVALSAQRVAAQAELAPWGNLQGIRVEGQLFSFESKITLHYLDPAKNLATRKEGQRPVFTRLGNTRLVTTRLDSLYLQVQAEDHPGNITRMTISGAPHGAARTEGLFLGFNFGASDYAATSGVGDGKNISLKQLQEPAGQILSSLTVRSSNPRREIELDFAAPTRVILKAGRQPGNASGDSKLPAASTETGLSLSIPIHTGELTPGEPFQKTFTIRAAGEIDKAPVSLNLDTTEGPAFAGFGGNFRLQNPKTDPQVIDYCLRNLRVAYSRVEMPFEYWQPGIEDNPIKDAIAGKMDKHVAQAMQLAMRLGKLHIPVILTAWSAPDWAIEGHRTNHIEGGIWGNPLNQQNIESTYKSIGDYIIYLRDNYKVNIALFSFNESDLGINIRQTPEQHDALIKGLGAYFVNHEIDTKILLGDNSDATSYKFIDAALNDPLARPFIGAISFHSWRGWDRPTLQHWAEAAARLNLPLIVGEGSIDAQAWGYPQIFKESSYALEEINLYLRLMAIVKPVSILQWQFTADYSPLTGAGIFGEKGPLLPTQRFYNMKQLASSPEGVFAMPVTVDRPEITAAGLGNNATGIYEVHIVNTGAARSVSLRGLPPGIKNIKVQLTDKTHQLMSTVITRRTELIRLELPAASFMSITGQQ